MKPNWDGEDGEWAVTNPPQEYNWGGSYIHAATGTDNPEHAKDIILALTGNKDNLLKISKDYSDFTNTKSGMQEVAKDDTSHLTSLADRIHLHISHRLQRTSRLHHFLLMTRDV